jgi:hypothetical protein
VRFGVRWSGGRVLSVFAASLAVLVAMSAAALAFGACGGGEAVSVTPSPTPAEVALTLDLTTPGGGYALRADLTAYKLATQR